MERQELEQMYGVGNVYDTKEMTKTFTVHSFSAPFIIVTNKDGERGTMEFQHNPRFYFSFVKS